MWTPGVATGFTVFPAWMLEVPPNEEQVSRGNPSCLISLTGFSSSLWEWIWLTNSKKALKNSSFSTSPIYIFLTCSRVGFLEPTIQPFPDCEPETCRWPVCVPTHRSTLNPHTFLYTHTVFIFCSIWWCTVTLPTAGTSDCLHHPPAHGEQDEDRRGRG